MLLDRFQQSPDEIKLKTIDYSNWLSSGETISTVVATATPVTAPVLTVTPAKTDTRVTLTTSDGLDDTTYTVNITITTSLGQKKEDCIEYIVEEIC